MAMNIKDSAAEALAAEVARRRGVTKTAAVRQALQESVDRLDAEGRGGQAAAEFVRFLREDIWPQVSEANRGKPISKAEREEILGFGPGGV